jgi:hypothetical protein
MNVLSILLSFAPWIVFGFIAGQSLVRLELAMVIALAVTILLSHKQLKKGYVLTWVTLLFFVLSFVAVALMKNYWVASHMGVLSYATLAAVTWGSVLAGQPWTLQYAKEEVDRSLWRSKSFIHVNQVITGAWGIVFLIDLAMNYYKLNHHVAQEWIFEVVGWVLILAGMGFTMIYTDRSRKRRLQQEQAAHGTASPSPAPVQSSPK